ncbi:MAG: hypothetical protein ACFCVG_11560 [Kineosporiaceae bacterium]
MAQALTLPAAADLTRTGDLWVFRGRSTADRTIQITTNSPVNHVGMALVLEDLPPLLWHAELGRGLVDVWSGRRRRGVQLHDLHDAVVTWRVRYGQQPFLRQLDPEAGDAMADAALRTVARLDGTPFPSTAGMAGRWLTGRIPGLRRRLSARELETAYCAEVVAITYTDMGLLRPGRPPGWYDPGCFWSGDRLPLTPGHRLGDEIPVTVPADARVRNPPG